MPFSLRLDPDTERRIRELADATGRTRSAVVREAVAQYAAEGAATPPAARTAFERLRAYVGIADSGGAQLSRRTHEKYQAVLEDKQHRARSTGRRRGVHRAARSK